MEAFAHQIAALAQRAVLYEVATNPKPGLVDPLNRGSHADMDFFTFLASGSAIYKGMFECVLTGIREHKSVDVLIELRKVGIECEKDMFAATKGINTHKGIIFSLGLICASAGILKGKNQSISTRSICDTVKRITRDLVIKDFQNLDNKKDLTQGEKFFKEYGIKGIRGEVELGFPTVINKGMPVLRELHEMSYTKNEMFLQVLLNIMTEVEDTNIISRGGIESLEFVQMKSREFIVKGGINNPGYKDELILMNNEFVDKNISPGGAADLLAVTILLGLLEGIIE